MLNNRALNSYSRGPYRFFFTRIHFLVRHHGHLILCSVCPKTFNTAIRKINYTITHTSLVLNNRALNSYSRGPYRFFFTRIHFLVRHHGHLILCSVCPKTFNTAIRKINYTITHLSKLRQTILANISFRFPVFHHYMKKSRQQFLL